MHAAQGPGGPPIRKHARVACHDVAGGVKIEGTEEWIQVQIGDLSLGGAFLVTERFIVEGTQVDVGLAFPSGVRLFFTAEVVRAVSESARGPAGLGLQFLPTTSENELALGRELDARMQLAPLAASPPHATGQVAALPSGPAAAAPAAAPSGAGELTTTIYDRLRLPPDCDDATLGEALERLIASVESSLEAIPAGQQRDQAQVFKQTLERMRPICQDPLKRIAYDFNNGQVRAEERIAAAAAGRGPPLLKLHEVWKRLFSNEVREAKRLFAESRKGGPDAAQRLAEARALDPFNPQLQPQAAVAPPPPPVAVAPLVAAAPPVAVAPPAVAATPPVAAPASAPNPFGTPPAPPAPPVVSPSPFGPPPTAPVEGTPIASTPIEGAPDPSAPADEEELPLVEPADVEELPLVEPDDFFGGLDP